MPLEITFIDLIRQILRASPEGMTPQQIRDVIKLDYPEFYATESHRRNVEKRHYVDLDHALLAQIYIAYRSAGDITSDKTQKPVRLSFTSAVAEEGGFQDQDIDSENLERLEAGIGILYVLGTNLFTKEGDEIVKIGITTGVVEKRIAQLYTTGVPFRFRIISQFETKNYSELELSLHKLLDPYRLNLSREFFTNKCLPFVDKIVSLHRDIQDQSIPVSRFS